MAAALQYGDIVNIIGGVKTAPTTGQVRADDLVLDLWHTSPVEPTPALFRLPSFLTRSVFPVPHILYPHSRSSPTAPSSPPSICAASLFSLLQTPLSFVRFPPRQYLDVESPGTGAIIARVGLSGAADVDVAVVAAHAALATTWYNGQWRKQQQKTCSEKYCFTRNIYVCTQRLHKSDALPFSSDTDTVFPDSGLTLSLFCVSDSLSLICVWYVWKIYPLTFARTVCVWQVAPKDDDEDAVRHPVQVSRTRVGEQGRAGPGSKSERCRIMFLSALSYICDSAADPISLFVCLYLTAIDIRPSTSVI
jgi:hypothetical protein